MINLSYIAIGLMVGIFSGALGVGGGLIVIPVLIYGLGLTQHQAQGTSLAMMIPPITLIAAWRYYHSGNVKVGMAVLLAIGFVAGGLIGAEIIHHISDVVLRRVFGAVIFLVSIKMLFF